MLSHGSLNVWKIFLWIHSLELFSELSGRLWKQNKWIFRQDVHTRMCCVARALRQKDLSGSEHHGK